MRPPSVLLASLVAAAVAGAATPPSIVPTDAGADRVVKRTDVPDATRKVGEVRLVQRGDAIVVQTLLATKAIARVLAEIHKKETENWPADRPGHDDMERYLAAIDENVEALRGERDAADGDRRVRLAIELVATKDAESLVLATFAGDETGGFLAPTDRRVLGTVALGRAYVVRNMRLILADSFHVPEPDVDQLAPLGPIAKP
jgi:hypothetical protein